ncbi:MAG: DinB family protein [Acidimicrobiales bacterium]
MTDERPWVRVQFETCEECGFDPAEVGPGDLPGAIRALERRYRIPLTRFLPGEDADVVVRARPSADTWSALEYACHVRDVLGVFDQRVTLALTEADPVLGWWDHEAAAVEEAYNAQDPVQVVDALARRAEALAVIFEAVPGDGWKRSATRRDGEVFTVAGMGRFALHEGSHHLLDIGRSLRAARGR